MFDEYGADAYHHWIDLSVADVHGVVGRESLSAEQLMDKVKAVNWKFKVKSLCRRGRKLAVFIWCAGNDLPPLLKLEDESWGKQGLLGFFFFFNTVLITDKGKKNKTAGLEGKLKVIWCTNVTYPSERLCAADLYQMVSQCTV